MYLPGEQRFRSPLKLVKAEISIQLCGSAANTAGTNAAMTARNLVQVLDVFEMDAMGLGI